MIRLVEPEIQEEDISVVADVLRSGQLAQASRVREFEERIAARVGCRHAVAVSSGTAALHLAMRALGIGPGDEVLVPDFTFPATANAVELVGATPVLVDVETSTLNLSMADLAAAVGAQARAIVPVHLFGQPLDMDPLLEFASARGLAVIEDAACALGAEYRGRPCGALADVGCFSFHPRKVITTGEGGMLTTNHDSLAETLRSLRNHGSRLLDGHLSFDVAGFNYRMTEFQAALGTCQLGRLDLILERRGALAALYRALLGGIPDLTLPTSLAHARPTWQAYVVLLPEGVIREQVIETMKGSGVETTLGTYALSAQPQHRGRARRPLAGSLRAYRSSLCLPLHPRMSEEQVKHVAESLRSACAEQR